MLRALISAMTLAKSRILAVARNMLVLSPRLPHIEADAILVASALAAVQSVSVTAFTGSYFASHAELLPLELYPNVAPSLVSLPPLSLSDAPRSHNAAWASTSVANMQWLSAPALRHPFLQHDRLLLRITLAYASLFPVEVPHTGGRAKKAPRHDIPASLARALAPTTIAAATTKGLATVAAAAAGALAGGSRASLAHLAAFAVAVYSLAATGSEDGTVANPLINISSVPHAVLQCWIRLRTLCFGQGLLLTPAIAAVCHSVLSQAAAGVTVIVLSPSSATHANSVYANDLMAIGRVLGKLLSPHPRTLTLPAALSESSEATKAVRVVSAFLSKTLATAPHGQNSTVPASSATEHDTSIKQVLTLSAVPHSWVTSDEESHSPITKLLSGLLAPVPPTVAPSPTCVFGEASAGVIMPAQTLLLIVTAPAAYGSTPLPCSSSSMPTPQTTSYDTTLTSASVATMVADLSMTFACHMFGTATLAEIPLVFAPAVVKAGPDQPQVSFDCTLAGIAAAISASSSVAAGGTPLLDLAHFLLSSWVVACGVTLIQTLVNLTPFITANCKNTHPAQTSQIFSLTVASARAFTNALTWSQSQSPHSAALTALAFALEAMTVTLSTQVVAARPGHIANTHSLVTAAVKVAATSAAHAWSPTSVDTSCAIKKVGKVSKASVVAASPVGSSHTLKTGSASTLGTPLSPHLLSPRAVGSQTSPTSSCSELLASASASACRLLRPALLAVCADAGVGDLTSFFKSAVAGLRRRSLWKNARTSWHASLNRNARGPSLSDANATSETDDSSESEDDTRTCDQFRRISSQEATAWLHLVHACPWLYTGSSTTAALSGPAATHTTHVAQSNVWSVDLTQFPRDVAVSAVQRIVRLVNDTSDVMPETQDPHQLTLWLAAASNDRERCTLPVTAHEARDAMKHVVLTRPLPLTPVLTDRPLPAPGSADGQVLSPPQLLAPPLFASRASGAQRATDSRPTVHARDLGITVLIVHVQPLAVADAIVPISANMPVVVLPKPLFPADFTAHATTQALQLARGALIAGARVQSEAPYVRARASHDAHDVPPVVTIPITFATSSQDYYGTVPSFVGSNENGRFALKPSARFVSTSLHGVLVNFSARAVQSNLVNHDAQKSNHVTGSRSSVVTSDDDLHSHTPNAVFKKSSQHWMTGLIAPHARDPFARYFLHPPMSHADLASAIVTARASARVQEPLMFWTTTVYGSSSVHADVSPSDVAVGLSAKLYTNVSQHTTATVATSTITATTAVPPRSAWAQSPGVTVFALTALQKREDVSFIMGGVKSNSVSPARHWLVALCTAEDVDVGRVEYLLDQFKTGDAMSKTTLAVVVMSSTCPSVFADSAHYIDTLLPRTSANSSLLDWTTATTVPPSIALSSDWTMGRLTLRSATDAVSAGQCDA